MASSFLPSELQNGNIYAKLAFRLNASAKRRVETARERLGFLGKDDRRLWCQHPFKPCE
jgi:hypothetical protein